jgi:multiple sugar transport system substrate-binding protein
MLKFKWCAILLIACLVVVPATTQAQDEMPTIVPQPCEEPGDLTMWIWSLNWAPLIQQSVDDWVENYCPGATVDLQLRAPFTLYWNFLSDAAANGTMPDVFHMSQIFFYDFASNDMMLNLQPYWNAAGIDTTMWGTGLVDPYRWGEAGDLYAGPVNWDTIVVFYNKDLFDAAGLPYPPEDWDWELFAQYAEALTDPEQGVYGALVYVGYQSGYGSWIASAGVEPAMDAARTRCTLTDEASLEALNFLKTLLDAGYMPKASDLTDELTPEEVTDRDVLSFWIDGKVAMAVGGSYVLPDALSEMTFNWDVVPLPRHPVTGRSRSMVHSVGYVASATTEHPNLAANLILYLISDEAQVLFAEAEGVAPANPSPQLQQLWKDSFGETGINIDVFISAIYDSQGMTIAGDVWDVVNFDLVLDIFERGMSVEDAVDKACTAIETYLEE